MGSEHDSEAGPFTAIPGQTKPHAVITGQIQDSWYRLSASCTVSGSSTVSMPVSIPYQTNTNACYCAPVGVVDDASIYINSVQLNAINNNSGSNATEYTSYVGRPQPNLSTTLGKGVSYTINININSPDNSTQYQHLAAWIDYNRDGDFTDAGEQLGKRYALSNGDHAFTFTVPVATTAGAARLRVRHVLNLSREIDPCNAAFYTETEDYLVTIEETTPCLELPVPAMATSSSSAVCAGKSFNLSVNTFPLSLGLTYQWEVSTIGAAGHIRPWPVQPT